MRPLPRWLRWTASAVVLAFAGWLLWRQLRGLEPAALWAAASSLPPLALAESLVATAISYLCLAAYERLATEWIAPGRIPRAVAWRTGLVAHALANTLGFQPLTAVALRLERYRAHGVDAIGLGKIVAAIGGCVLVGMLAILLAAAGWWLWRSIGPLAPVSLVLAVAAFALLPSVRTRVLPARSLVQGAQVFGLGLVEMVSSYLAFVVLLPAGALPDGPALVLLFVGATVLGVVSHAPGGLGVFEATLLAAARPDARAPVLAALLAYRLVYGLLPCAMALAAVTGRALRLRFNSTVDISA